MNKKRTRVYKPRPINSDAINTGMKNVMSDVKQQPQPQPQQQQQGGIPNYWGVKPMSQQTGQQAGQQAQTGQQKIQIQPQKKIQMQTTPAKMNFGQPLTAQPLTMQQPFQMQQQQQQPAQQPAQQGDEEPYWSGEQWEEWAMMMYDNYPDTHKFLPDWFISAMQEME